MIDLSSGFFFADDNGETVKFDLLFSFKGESDGNTYIVYTANEEDEDGNVMVYASYFNEEKYGTKLKNIEDDKMFDIINAMLVTAVENAEKDADGNNIKEEE